MRKALAALILASPLLAAPGDDAGPAREGKAPRQVHVRVTRTGFEPSLIRAKLGVPVTIVFERITDETCIKAVDIPDESVSGLALPLGKPVSVTFTPRRAGLQKFHCSAMGMGNGRIVVDR